MFHSFYLCFCFGPDVCTGNFSFKICGVVPWRGGVRNTILLHTHAHIILSQHFTNNFSLHTTLYSHTTPSCTENGLRLLSFVLVYQHALYFPVSFSRWEVENFYIVFPYTVKKKVFCSTRLGIRNTSCLSYYRHWSFLGSALSHNNVRSLLPPAKHSWRESNQGM
jgi:hypothetical protein